MGIPRFFRWISERYPCITQQITDQDMPEFDNLYIDMNGIIHTCSYSEENKIISETEIFLKIRNYLEFLFLFVNPKKVLFLAIDGVAPRAKMNQQRGRRFKAAKEREEQLRYALKKCEDLRPFARFDSNCITPGTEFMANLERNIIEFLTQKVSDDPLWCSVEVIFSSHLTPGEGEHKIMDYIRHSRSSENYDPNIRHCLYGLDADLIVLALSTHESYITLLREEVKFNRGKQNLPGNGRTEAIHFNLLHVTLLRNYIDLEFSSLKSSESVDFNLDRVLDDWILLTFFIGNDFLPPIPNFSINNDAFSILWNTYKKVFSLHGGYLSEKGVIDKVKLKEFFQQLYEFDQVIYNNHYYNKRRRYRRNNYRSKSNNESTNESFNTENLNASNCDDEIPSVDEPDPPQQANQKSDTIDVGAAPINTAESNSLADEMFKELPCELEIEIDAPNMKKEPLTQEEKYSNYRFYYYRSKVGLEVTNESSLTSLIRDYIHTLEWVLHYYVCGTGNWSWFYPHHYAPMLQDLSAFFPDDLSPDYSHTTKSSPFKPLHQLMAVLPPQSFTFLPYAYQSLIISKFSPILSYYPTRFKVDRSLGSAKWDCIAILPFIDSSKLTSCLEDLEEQLTSLDKERNNFKPSIRLRHICEASVQNTNSLSVEMNLLPIDYFVTEKDKLVLGKHPKFCEKFQFGQPTLSLKAFSWSLQFSETKVFETASSCESLILDMKTERTNSLESIAKTCLNKIALAKWPWHSVIRITRITDGYHSYQCSVPTETFLEEPQLISNDNITSTEMDDNLSKQIAFIKEGLLKDSLTRCGLKIKSSASKESDEEPEMPLVVYGKALLGFKWVPFHDENSGQITRLVQVWSHSEEPHLFDRLLFLQHTELFSDFLRLESQLCRTREAFPRQSRAYLLDQEHYGQSVRVVEPYPPLKLFVEESLKATDLHLKCSDLSNNEKLFVSAEEIARQCNLSVTFVQVITGHVYLHRSNSKRSIGLSLKWNMAGEQVEGWSKRIKDSISGEYGGLTSREDLWLYSQDIVPVLQEYRDKFSEVWSAIVAGSEQAPPLVDYNEEEVFGKKDGGRIKSLTTFLHSLPSYNAPKRIWGTEELPENSLLKVEAALMTSDDRYLTPGFELPYIEPRYLYNCWNVIGRVDIDQNATWQLLDHVVKVTASYSTIKPGSHGYIIGIYTHYKNNNPRDGFLYSYKVLFDSPFFSGTPLKPGSAMHWIMLPSYILINVSHNERVIKLKP